jgi:signal transduction histidine kinase
MTLIKAALVNLTAKFYLTNIMNMIRNIHFWIIIVLIGLLTTLYYGWSYWFPWFWRYFVFEFGRDIHGTLFLIPFIYASFIFWWRGAIVVWLISAGVMLPFVIYYSSNLESFLFNGVLSFIPLAVIILIASELKWRNRQRKLLVEREEERQVYMSQIFTAQEDERQHLAQELHDGITQELLVVANRAQSLVNRDRSEISMEVRNQATWIRDAILQISKDIRQQSVDLRPSILDDMGLVSALRWLVNRLNEEGDIHASIILHGTERKLSSKTEVNIFRIVQEGLNNIRHHSKATEAVVTLQIMPTFLEIIIQDNGEGFPLNETIENLTSRGKLGLIGMQQRARFIGSTFNIDSEIGKGTRVSLKLADQPR